jgi:hypothetical protein
MTLLKRMWFIAVILLLLRPWLRWQTLVGIAYGPRAREGDKDYIRCEVETNFHLMQTLVTGGELEQ